MEMPQQTCVFLTFAALPRLRSSRLIATEMDEGVHCNFAKKKLNNLYDTRPGASMSLRLSALATLSGLQLPICHCVGAEVPKEIGAQAFYVVHTSLPRTSFTATLHLDTIEHELLGLVRKLKPCDAIPVAKCENVVWRKLQYEQGTTNRLRKNNCTTTAHTTSTVPASTTFKKTSEIHVNNVAYHHFCPRPWWSASPGRPQLACHHQWDWALPLWLGASRSPRQHLAGTQRGQFLIHSVQPDER